MDKWMKDFEKYTVLWSEKEFAIRIRDLRGYRTHDVLRGKFDIGMMDEFETSWLFETKTTARGVDERIKTIDIDEQIDLYQMVCEFVPDLLPNFGGIVYNVVRKKSPTIPRILQRPAGTLSKAKDIDTTYEVYLNTILEHGLNPADYQDILAILKEKGDRFYDRRIIVRDKQRIDNVKKSLYYTVKEIKNNAKLYRSKQDINTFHRTPSFMCPKMCDYCELCIMQSKNADWTSYAKDTFEIRDKTNPELEQVDIME
jgi:hypothetical protein